MIATFFIMTVVHLLQGLEGQSVTMDLHIDQNNYFLAALYYMHTLNQFLPIEDAVLPLMAITFVIMNGMTLFKIFLFVKSFVPTISGGG